MSELQGFFFHDFKNAFVPHILKEVYIDKVYDRFLLGKKDLTIVDVGGNIGLTSFFFKDYAKKVYCMEPAKLHIESINKLIEFNKIENIKIVPYALAANDGNTKFYHNPNTTMYSMNSIVSGEGEFEEVETLTLESLMKKEQLDHIDFMKLDVEGSEGEIIVSDGFTRVADKIDVIVGEWHSWSSQNQQMFANTFRDLGFKFDWYKNTEASVFSALRL